MAGGGGRAYARGVATYNLRPGLTPANVGVIFIDSLRTLDLQRQFTENATMYAPDADVDAVRVLDSIQSTVLTKIADNPAANEARYLMPLLALVPYTATVNQGVARRADRVFEGGAFPVDDLHPGIITPTTPDYSTSGLTGTTANRAFFNRFVLTRPRTIISIGFFIGVAASLDDAVDVGIYDSSLNRLVSKGATNGLLNSTGIKNPSITPTPLQAGVVYYAAWSMGTIAGTVMGVATRNQNTADHWRLFSTTAPDVDVEIMAAGHPLPATATPAGTGINNTPIIIPRWA